MSIPKTKKIILRVINIVVVVEFGIFLVYYLLNQIDIEDKRKVVYFEWVRFTNIYNQKPVVEDELKFIAKYPEIVRKLFTMLP